jgi:hypothetical protein
MLNSQSAAFAERVWDIAARIGHSAPKITDDIMEAAFPRTCAQARQEGALKMLRTGVVAEVKRILRSGEDSAEQSDFADVSQTFAPLVRDLRSKSYFVERAQEYVPVHALIAEPELLDDARRFMRRKGIECLAEADRLDLLYQAVLARGDVVAPPVKTTRNRAPALLREAS